jgi:hypothetical protein
VDSASAKTSGRQVAAPAYFDYLEGARYVFNVAPNPSHSPRDGDTDFYGVRVNQIVIVQFKEPRRHFALG